MRMLTGTKKDTGAPARRARTGRWEQVRDRFLAAVHPMQQPAVNGLLRQPRSGGLGLRMWLQALASRGGHLPGELPVELIQVYLENPEAVPLHDCANCGLAIPVHPGVVGYESDPQRVYFPKCPVCGGRTGLHAYWSSAKG